jgi:energy-coupling factor transport system permease protein
VGSRHTAPVAGASVSTDRLRPLAPPLPRALHPVAWWVWAIGLAVAASLTANPLLLALILAVVTLVVINRRSDSPWGRAFRLYVILGAFVVLSRLVLHLLVGLKLGEHRLFWLPSVTLPVWAAGINLGGTVYLEGLLAAGVQGLRLGTMIVCIGAANALANPKRLLRTLPGSLQEIGTAVIVSVTVAPQLAESVQRVLRARHLRGQNAGGLRSVRQVALPVLQDTLDRSLALAAAMDSRGYGRRVTDTREDRRRVLLATCASFAGLIGASVGLFGLLSAETPALLGAPLLVVGLALAVVGLRLGGRGVQRTTYRPDPWSAPEWLTAATGLVACAATIVASHLDPVAMNLQVSPLAWPGLPWVAAAGILLAALPGYLTPEPQR